jgi:hypothetical protein
MDSEAQASAFQVDFYCTSRTLQTSFEIRYRFTCDQWQATIHPMDGPTWKIEGGMHITFADFFAQLLSGVGRSDARPERIAS